MTDNEIIAKQARKIIEMKEQISEFKQSSLDIHMRLYCIGGPLNGNFYQYTKEQRKVFHDIDGHLITT